VVKAKESTYVTFVCRIDKMRSCGEELISLKDLFEKDLGRSFTMKEHEVSLVINKMDSAQQSDVRRCSFIIGDQIKRQLATH